MAIGACTCADSRLPAASSVSTENKSTSTLNTSEVTNTKMNGQTKGKPSRWSFVVPLIVLGICMAVFAATVDDEDFANLDADFQTTNMDDDEAHGTCGNGESTCPINSGSTSELIRLQRENEQYRKALSWIEKRQKTFIKKFVSSPTTSSDKKVDKESIIKWLAESQTAYYKEFPAKNK